MQVQEKFCHLVYFMILDCDSSMNQRNMFLPFIASTFHLQTSSHTRIYTYSSKFFLSLVVRACAVVCVSNLFSSASLMFFDCVRYFCKIILQCILIRIIRYKCLAKIKTPYGILLHLIEHFRKPFIILCCCCNHSE